jgi:sugar phosphate isomerase/epimerase
MTLGLAAVGFGQTDAVKTYPAGGDMPSTAKPRSPSMFAPDNLVAWCIVPFDSLNRTPVERIAMLQRLGFTQYAWDWRQKHLQDLPTEISLARAAGVRIRAVWLWIDEQSDRPDQLSVANRTVIDAVIQAGLSVEYWVGFHANFFAGLDEPAQIRKGAAMIATIRDQAARTHSAVNLYNHGDWFGEPDNQIKIIKALGDPTVGLVYNFHHAHAQIARFPDLLPRMLPYLRVVNLDGLRPEGPMILPLGTGTEERGMIKMLETSGYQGAIGILGHTEGEDVELVLRRNLDGLRKIQAAR